MDLNNPISQEEKLSLTPRERKLERLAKKKRSEEKYISTFSKTSETESFNLEILNAHLKLLADILTTNTDKEIRIKGDFSSEDVARKIIAERLTMILKGHINIDLVRDLLSAVHKSIVTISEEPFSVTIKTTQLWEETE